MTSGDNQSIGPGFSQLRNYPGEQRYIWHPGKVFFVVHHKDIFAEQNSLSLFKRLGR